MVIMCLNPAFYYKWLRVLRGETGMQVSASSSESTKRSRAFTKSVSQIRAEDLGHVDHDPLFIPPSGLP
jgi:hypothetical protein